MTLREKMIQMLFERFLFEAEANAVMDAATAQLTTCDPEWARRQNEDVSGYPPQLLAAVWMHVKAAALEWIDANKPRHFARQLFEPGSP